MADLHLSDLEHYRKPKGWVEFWVGLVLMVLVSCMFGRIIYMENLVKQGDLEFKQQQMSETETKVE